MTFRSRREFIKSGITLASMTALGTPLVRAARYDRQFAINSSARCPCSTDR